VVHALNPSSREAEVGGFLSFRAAWSTEVASGQKKIHSETKTQNKKQKTKKQKTKPQQYQNNP
jgi:hypothetical protein